MSRRESFLFLTLSTCEHWTWELSRICRLCMCVQCVDKLLQSPCKYCSKSVHIFTDTNYSDDRFCFLRPPMRCAGHFPCLSWTQHQCKLCSLLVQILPASGKLFCFQGDEKGFFLSWTVWKKKLKGFHFCQDPVTTKPWSGAGTDYFSFHKRTILLNTGENVSLNNYLASSKTKFWNGKVYHFQSGKADQGKNPLSVSCQSGERI